MQQNKWLQALYAMIGAIAPDILILYSKRWTMPQVTFSIPQYTFASILYLGLAGIVSLIFPYKTVFKSEANLPWKSFSIGFSLPLILSTIAALSRSQLIVPRGGSMSGTLHDLLALF
jgi:hypothetical protein